MKTQKIINILFMDGDCLFCQNSVQVLYKLDQQKRLHFSRLQGETAKVLPEDWRVVLDGKGQASGNVALIENFEQTDEKRWRGADAVFRSLYLIGGIWKTVWLFYYIPHPVKKFCYQLIAKNRHRFTDGKKACKLPSSGFSGRFVK